MQFFEFFSEVINKAFVKISWFALCHLFVQQRIFLLNISSKVNVWINVKLMFRYVYMFIYCYCTYIYIYIYKQTKYTSLQLIVSYSYYNNPHIDR